MRCTTPSGVHLLGQTATESKPEYIDFKRIGIVTGRISLPYCYCLVIAINRISIHLFIAYVLRLSLSIQVKYIRIVLM